MNTRLLYPHPVQESSMNPPVLAVIGVGYVGEHLVYAFSSSFEVTSHRANSGSSKAYPLLIP
jgi:hypothetical protein